MDYIKDKSSKMELLAPAGTVEVFEVAVEAGADAVYIGAPFFNARELARHFSLAEVAAMIDYGHRKGVKVYVAMNSLVREDELARVIETLAVFAELGPDAVIIQDLGLYQLVRKFFPSMRIHASTLMAAHNSAAVGKLAAMGYSRVVLPRELTIEEITKVAAATDVELEVFIHGAMCFSYSGLCLFSSCQGGRSGLRGRCVQPCRRRYTWQGRGKKGGGGGGYLFSMNDLQGIDLLDELRLAGVKSLKIEGRMRSPNYVGNVVKAYRTVLDAPPGETSALKSARQLLASAMGRKATRGYFQSAAPADIIAPQHSGNIGLFLGKIKPEPGRYASVVTREAISIGDRLRLHQEQSGERQSFTLKKIKAGGRFVDRAGQGTTVSVELPVAAAAGDAIYKVDLADNRGRAKGSGIAPERYASRLKKLDTFEMARKIMAEINGPRPQGPTEYRPQRAKTERAVKKGSRSAQLPLPVWIRSDDPFILSQRYPVFPEKVVINLSGEAFNRFMRMKRSGPLFRRVVWALPPVIDEDRLPFFMERISLLIDQGFQEWQVGHFGQIPLFQGTGCRLYGDTTLNLLNSLTTTVLMDNGLQGGLISIETDRQNLGEICRVAANFRLGMTVYGFPALFTSRAAGPPMQFDRVFVSPRGESFSLRKAWGYTMASSTEPFTLLAELNDLAGLGIHYAVIDLSGQLLDHRVLEAIFREAAGGAPAVKGSSFNFHHVLR